jgi:hypothetical protein
MTYCVQVCFCKARVLEPRSTPSTKILRLTDVENDAAIIQATGTLLPTSESAAHTVPGSLDVPGNRYDIILNYNCCR